MATLDSRFRRELIDYNKLSNRSLYDLLLVMNSNSLLTDKYLIRKLEDGYQLNQIERRDILRNLAKAGVSIDYRGNFYDQLLIGINTAISQPVVPPITLPVPTASVDFTQGGGSSLAGTVTSGLAQKVDNTYQAFSSSIRLTDRGLVVEPPATNYIFPSVPDNVTGYSLTNSFTAINSKTSVIPGSTAKEYVSNGTTAILVQATNAAAGTWTSNRECMWCILETTATSSASYLTMEDVTNNKVILNLNLGNLLTNTPSLGTQGPDSTLNTWGSINLGTGPNGGILWLFSTSGIANITGGTRKFRLRPNGVGAPANGASVILHHVQHEVNAYPTSPILNATVAANSRGAESLSMTVPSGTYNVKYYLQDGTRYNKIGITVTGNTFQIPLDICQMPVLNTGSSPGPTVQVQQRTGYITKIEVWAQYPDLFILGDSFAGTPTSTWTPYFMRIPRNFDRNTTFGGSTTQEADNWDTLTGNWGNVLIIMDGGLTAGETPTTYLTSIARIIARLTLNPKKWLFIETCPAGVDGNEIGSTWYNNYQACMDAVKAAYPDNYVPTKAIMQTYVDGGATDAQDVANGFWPRSNQIDRLHPTDLGSQRLCPIITNALFAKGF